MNVVLTALGVFLCSAIACETNPPGLVGYFRPPTVAGDGRLMSPTLAVMTKARRIVRAVECETVPGRWPGPVTVWRCDGDGGDPDPRPPGS